MSEAMAPCPPDSDIMKAWKAYQETESFKNSFRYVTEEQRKELQPLSGPTANATTDWHRDQWAQGSMWAAFMSGWLAARGENPNGPPCPSR